MSIAPARCTMMDGVMESRNKGPSRTRAILTRADSENEQNILLFASYTCFKPPACRTKGDTQHILSVLISKRSRTSAFLALFLNYFSTVFIIAVIFNLARKILIYPPPCTQICTPTSLERSWLLDNPTNCAALCCKRACQRWGLLPPHARFITGLPHDLDRLARRDNCCSSTVMNVRRTM